MLAADWVMMARFASLVVKIVCAVVTVSLVVLHLCGTQVVLGYLARYLLGKRRDKRRDRTMTDTEKPSGFF